MTTDQPWRRPARCDSGTCVEVAMYPNAVYVRDSKLDPSPVLHYTADEWRKLIAYVRENEWCDFDWLTDGAQWMTAEDESVAWIGKDATLYFTRDEIDAFVKSAQAGEFDLPEVTR